MAIHIDPHDYVTPQEAQRRYAVVEAAAHKYGIPVQIMWGIFGHESGFGTNLGPSSMGAKGPFQFMPATWATYGRGGDVNNLQDSADAAGRYLRDLFHQYHSWQVALDDHYSGGLQGYYDTVLKVVNPFSGATASGTAKTRPQVNLGDVASPVVDTVHFLTGLTDPQLWIRIGLVILGGVGIFIGLSQVTKTAFK